MKNILCNLQLFHLKHLLKTGRSCVNYTSIKCFSSSLFGYPTLNDWDSEKRKDLLVFKKNIRSLNMSVKKFEKLSEIKLGEEKKNDIIYIGVQTHQVKGLKALSFTSSIGGIFLNAWLYQNMSENAPLGTALLVCIGYFTWVTPFVSHLITKKYVAEIWYNSVTDTYTATLFSFFLRRINIDFKVEDIVVPSVPSIFTTMFIKGKPVNINSNSFLEPKHYIRIMGYDKPMDQKLDSSEKLGHEEKSKIM